MWNVLAKRCPQHETEDMYMMHINIGGIIFTQWFTNLCRIVSNYTILFFCEKRSPCMMSNDFVFVEMDTKLVSQKKKHVIFLAGITLWLSNSIDAWQITIGFLDIAFPPCFLTEGRQKGRVYSIVKVSIQIPMLMDLGYGEV